MTFSDIVQAVQSRLSINSPESFVRIGFEVNDRYKRVTSTLGLNVIRRTTVQQNTSIGIARVVFAGVEKLYNVVNRSSTPHKVLAEITIEELRALTQVEASRPRAYAIVGMGNSTVTIELDCIPQTVFPLFGDGEANASNLIGTQIPNIPESFHDILVHGTLADEYRRMEKVQLARDSESDYERRLSDLRQFIAKSAYLDIYQGKTSKTAATTAASSSGGGSSNGSSSYTQVGLVTFDRSSAAPNDAPFAVVSGANKVDNLDADKLDGLDSTAFATATGLTITTNALASLTTAFGIHHTRHEAGGSDSIKLDNLESPDDNTDLNVSNTAHGLTPKLPNDATKYLDGTGAYTVPPNGIPNPIVQDLLFTDTLYDIGKSGASRPRDLFISRNEVVGGTLGVTGILSPAALLDLSGAGAGQVKFPASQNASGNANTLDDYEEGTFTPTVIGQTSGAATYIIQVGQYTKIGAHVFFSIYITTATNGTIVGNVQIGGLPFLAKVVSNAYNGISLSYFTGLGSSVASLGGYVPPGTQFIQLFKVIAGGATANSVVASTDIGATELILSGHFQST